MAAVMASDSQILALSTMFTEDVFAFSTAARLALASRFQVATGRTFIVIITIVAYLIALRLPQSILRRRDPIRVSPVTRR